MRLLELPADYHRSSLELRQISGGLLVQESDTFDNLDSSTWTLAAGDEVDAATRADLEFAWKACRSVKSNAILLARGGASVGVGMGQVNRVDSCHLAVLRAGDRAAGSVAASDAFFPFADGLQVLLDAGVTAVVQPGGSVRDAEVIRAAADAGVTMYFTGERHFFHQVFTGGSPGAATESGTIEGSAAAPEPSRQEGASCQILRDSSRPTT